MPVKKLLAIETSGKICSVALCSFNDEPCLQNTPLHKASQACEIIAEYSIHIGNKHDKFCAELCNRILKDNDIVVCDLASVAVSQGPGSFTGLRIGLAVAKGLCFGSKEEAINLIAVPTLNAIALKGVTWLLNKKLPPPTQENKEQNLPLETTTQQLLAIIHSHSNLYYYQLFSAAGAPLSDIGFSDMASIKAQFANESIYIGTNSKIDIDFGFYLPQLSYLTAEAIGRLGAIQFTKQQFADATDVQPLYVQNFVPR